MEKTLLETGFLTAIRDSQQRELKERKTAHPLAELKRIIGSQPEPLDFAAAIGGKDLSLIAEVKKASPSKGLFLPVKDAVSLSRQYALGGASAISVVTEEKYFKGRLGDLKLVRESVSAFGIPLLRKDFLLEPYHVYESRARGADAVLLIVALLETSLLKEMLETSHALGMECLVETHNETEMERALKAGAKIIGINNRDLATFRVDLGTTESLMRLIPAGKLIVSESGISTSRDIAKMRQLGVNAVLIGETLVTAADVPALIGELFDQD